MSKKKLVGALVAVALAVVAVWAGPDVVQMVRDSVGQDNGQVAPVDSSDTGE